MKVKLISINARYLHSCPALYYLRQELSEHLPGLDTQLIHFTINDPYYATLNRICEGDPVVVFISVYIWNSSYVQRLLPDLGKTLPRTRIVLGGPQAAYIFDRSGKTLSTMPERITLVKGEIEGVGRSFYDDLAADCLKLEYQASVAGSFPAPYREADFAGELQNRYIYYESSRGCPFACAYCLSAGGRGVRHKESGQVENELSAILRHRPRMVRFVDRSFNDRPDRALAIWRFLASAAHATLFHFEIVPDRFNEEMFELLAAVAPGRFQFEIGIQSTNPETLAAVNRSCDQEKMRANIARLVSFDNIHIHLDLIIGLPYETAATFRKSFNDVFALLPHYIQMGLLKVLPDTKISEAAKDFGLVCCAAPPYEVLATGWLDRRELSRLFWFGETVEAFYNKRFFRSLWSYIRRRGEDGFSFFEALLGVCRRHGFFARSPTQELMSSMLFELAGQRPDQDLLRELLSFDWLRCGHRFLPDHLQEGEPLPAVKNRLWQQLPQNLAGFYDYAGRDEFFKRAVFAVFTGEILREVGLADAGRRRDVCFLPEKEPGVFGFCRTVLLPEEE